MVAEPSQHALWMSSPQWSPEPAGPPPLDPQASTVWCGSNTAHTPEKGWRWRCKCMGVSPKDLRSGFIGMTWVNWPWEVLAAEQRWERQRAPIPATWGLLFWTKSCRRVRPQPGRLLAAQPPGGKSHTLPREGAASWVDLEQHLGWSNRYLNHWSIWVKRFQRWLFLPHSLVEWFQVSICTLQYLFIYIIMQWPGTCEKIMK